MTGQFISPQVLGAFAFAGLAGAALSVWLGSAEIECSLWANQTLALARGGLAGELPAETSIKELQKQARSMALGACLLAATVSAWFCAILTLKAIREYRFVFYVSAEEEQTAFSQASMERRVGATEETCRVRNTIGLGIILVRIFVLTAPFLYWRSR